MTNEHEDFYIFNTGPFSVRIFVEQALVESNARVYLAYNKYFGFEVDYGEDFGMPSVEPANYNSAMRAILPKESQLLAINSDRFSPKNEGQEEPESDFIAANIKKTKRVINIVGQLALFDGTLYNRKQR